MSGVEQLYWEILRAAIPAFLSLASRLIVPISKKNQFALFAFQRTLHLLAAFCVTICLKLCNQKTRFILRLI